MKNVRTALVVLALAAVLAASFALAQKSDQAEVLLKAAANQELVDGDLNAAIELYKKVVAQPGASRAAVAKALVQMGQCYRKQGNAEARRLFERVLREFADQTEAVSEARAQLALLSETAGPPASQTMTVRKLWDLDTKIVSYIVPYNVSADGRFMSFHDWDTGNVGVYDVMAGQSRLVTQYGKWDSTKGYTEANRISPDGKWIAFCWYRGKGSELRVIRVDGSGTRTLYDGGEAEWVAPAAWSSDGKFILAQIQRKPEDPEKPRKARVDLCLVAFADGSVRFLKTFDSWLGSAGLSPDGRFIAYAHQYIYVLPADGGAEVPIVQGPAQHSVLGWSPDGKHILFGSDRSGAWGLWSIRMEGGKAVGSPEMIKPDSGRMSGLGFGGNRAFYYIANQQLSNAYMAQLDAADGRLVGSPSRVTERFENLNSTPMWSPDGRQLAYFGRRGADDSTGPILVVRSTDSGEERDVLLRVPMAAAAAATPSWLPGNRWLPDNRSMIFVRTEKDGTLALDKIDTATGEATPVATGLKAWLLNCTWSGDGSQFFYNKEKSIMVRNVASGEEKELYSLKDGSNIRQFAASSDGKKLAYIAGRTLHVLSLETGQDRELVRRQGQQGDFRSRALAWTADSRHLIWVIQESTGSRASAALWIAPAQGGQPRQLAPSLEGRIVDLAAHPDGKTIGFSRITGKSELWVMENFLPPIGSGR